MRTTITWSHLPPTNPPVKEVGLRKRGGKELRKVKVCLALMIMLCATGKRTTTHGGTTGRSISPAMGTSTAVATPGIATVVMGLQWGLVWSLAWRSAFASSPSPWSASSTHATITRNRQSSTTTLSTGTRHLWAGASHLPHPSKSLRWWLKQSHLWAGSYRSLLQPPSTDKSITPTGYRHDDEEDNHDQLIMIMMVMVMVMIIRGQSDLVGIMSKHQFASLSSWRCRLLRSLSPPKQLSSSSLMSFSFRYIANVNISKRLIHWTLPSRANCLKNNSMMTAVLLSSLYYCHHFINSDKGWNA